MPKQKALSVNDLDYSSLKCKICGDPSSGKHYGIYSCFRCKTFFRRAVLQNQDTKCIMRETCTNSKKLCRGCRYRKCIKMGMSKQSLQPKRDTIGVRMAPLPESDVKSKLSDADQQLLKMITDLTKLDNGIRIKKFEAINSKKAAKRLSEELKAPSFSCSEIYGDDLQLMASNDISIGTQIDLLCMIEWAKTIPIFNEILLTDQLKLIKRFSSKYLTLENAFFTALHSKKKDDIYLICTGGYMPRQITNLMKDKDSLTSARAWRQEKLWKQMVTSILDEVVTPLKLYRLLPQEMLVLKVLILFHCGNHNHQDQDENATLPIDATTRKKIIAFKERIIAALFAYYKFNNHPNYIERFGNLLLMTSGVLSSANVLLEAYQIMRLFEFAKFDAISEKILFNTEE